MVQLELLATSPDAQSALPFQETCRLIELSRAAHDSNRPLKVVVVGGFNRGKSSLINAIVDTPILPTSVLPETQVVTEITSAPIPTTRVETGDGSCIPITMSDAPDLIKNGSSSEPCDKVRRMLVGHPSGILSRFTFVDTPGLSGGFTDFGDVVAESIGDADCVLFAVSATEPLSFDETLFFEHVCRASGRPPLAIVLTMTDRLAEPSELERVTANVSARLRSTAPGVCLMAVGGLDSANQIASMQKSGLATVVDYLERLSLYRNVSWILQQSSRALGILEHSLVLLDAPPANTPGDFSAVIPLCEQNDRERLTAQRLQFASAWNECRLEAMHWMRAFARRIDNEVIANLHSCSVVDVQRGLHFFLVDVMREALETCLWSHWDTVEMQFVPVTFEEVRENCRELAVSSVAVGFGEWTPADASAFVGGVASGIADGVAPRWAHWVRIASTLCNLFNGFNRHQSADAVVRSEVSVLRDQLPAISEFLSSQVSELYQLVEANVLELFDKESSTTSTGLTPSTLCERTMQEVDTDASDARSLVAMRLRARIEQCRDEVWCICERAERELNGVLNGEVFGGDSE